MASLQVGMPVLTPSTSLLNAGIQLDCRSKEPGRDFKVINLYGPYVERNPFWDMLIPQDSLASENVIKGEDLNLTLHSREI